MSKQSIAEFSATIVASVINAGRANASYDEIEDQCAAALMVYNEDITQTLTPAQSAVIVVNEMLTELIDEISDNIKLEMRTQIQVELDTMNEKIASLSATTKPRVSMADFVAAL